MADATQVQEIVQSVVGDVFAAMMPSLRDEFTQLLVERLQPALLSSAAEVFDSRIPALRDEVIQSVLERLQPALAASAAEAGPTEQLKTAMVAIQEAPTQSDILRALLEVAAGFCARTALFLVRGDSAVGWEARGFSEDGGIKELTLDLKAGLGERAFRQRFWVEGPTEQFEPAFVIQFGAPFDDKCLIMPLVIRDKVAALLYADAGTETGGRTDASALEVLVRHAAIWLELLALRKLAAAQASAVAATATASPDSAEATAAGGARAGVGTAPLEAAPAVAQTLSSAQPTLSSSLGYPPPSTAPGAEKEDLQRKARRFAKLLVDEIKLYNQAKVAEGKRNHDLYDRLKEDIDKSRSTYEKRYAKTTVATTDWFTQELVRNLADNDPTLLGSSFSH